MLECKICGCKFPPVIDKHYISRDNGESGVSTVLRKVEGNLYDTFDCPSCGCQMIVQERKRPDKEAFSEALKSLAKDKREEEHE